MADADIRLQTSARALDIGKPREARAQARRVNATPLTISEWEQLLKEEGFKIGQYHR